MHPHPVAAADFIAPVLRGAPRGGRVAAVFSGALIIDCPATTDRPAAVLALLAARASAVPVGVRSTEPLPAASVGASVQVGAGGLALSGTSYLVSRTWPSAVPRIDPDPRRLARLADRSDRAALGLDRAWVAALGAALESAPAAAGEADQGDEALLGAVRALVGRGAGSTPAGDDVLAGTMVGLHALGRADLAHRLGGMVDQSRTTPYSAALLAGAADGHAMIEALAVLRWLHRTAPGDGDAPAERLLAVGHTSGADLTAGLLVGLGGEHLATGLGAEALAPSSTSGAPEPPAATPNRPPTRTATPDRSEAA